MLLLIPAMSNYQWHGGDLLYEGVDLLRRILSISMALCRPDCNEVTGDEDELVAACQDVVRGIEAGSFSKEEVKKARADVRKVSADIPRHCSGSRDTSSLVSTANAR